MLFLGVPVLNRYDLLPRLLESAEDGIVVPDRYLIVDNGGRFNESCVLSQRLESKVDIYRPGKNVGVASAWNYIIKITEGNQRIISNDDIILDRLIIKDLLNAVDDGYSIVGIYGKNPLNFFSLFCITDNCVNRIGYFDESISPNYGYFEDNDYYYRMYLAEERFCSIHAPYVMHEGSATIKSYSEKETKDHHEKFKIARNNYIKKWGGMPNHETFDKPFGK